MSHLVSPPLLAEEDDEPEACLRADWTAVLRTVLSTGRNMAGVCLMIIGLLLEPSDFYGRCCLDAVYTDYLADLTIDDRIVVSLLSSVLLQPRSRASPTAALFNLKLATSPHKKIEACQFAFRR